MAENFLGLSPEDRNEALNLAADRSGRPAYLLEKDVWVVWALSVVAERFGEHLVFKGGTSLSKAYKVIDRFSEDIDLTYDIRQLLLGEDGLKPGEGDGLPPSGSKARRWTEKVRERLPAWIAGEVEPLLRQAIADAGIDMAIRREATDTVHLDYPPAPGGRDYVKPSVMLEFGARSTGRPAAKIEVTSDAAPHLPDVSFPTATPYVMALGRTFWEKATAAHVYCVQGDLRGERYARHWHDLAAIARHPDFASAVADKSLAEAVATHKSHFFKAKNPGDGSVIDYLAAVKGGLRLVPEGQAARLLHEDYGKMVEAGLLHGTPADFDAVMDACRSIERAANAPVKAADAGQVTG